MRRDPTTLQSVMVSVVYRNVNLDIPDSEDQLSKLVSVERECIVKIFDHY